MAGIIHEVEKAELLQQVKEEAVKAANELVAEAQLHKGQVVVVGCSTSEVVGRKVGSWSTPEVAQAIFDGLNSVFGPLGIYIAAQCCEHLNRALIVDYAAVPGAEIVNVMLEPNDTKTLDFKKYYYDIQLIKISGWVDTIIENSIFKVGVEIG
mgnify:CR=1 FL=1